MKAVLYGVAAMMAVSVVGAMLALIVIERDAVWVAAICLTIGLLQSGFIVWMGADSLRAR